MTGLLWFFGVLGVACGIEPALHLAGVRRTQRKFDRLIRESWR